MRKYWWAWAVLAFVAGLALGVGLFLFTRETYIANNRQILSRNAHLLSENRQLKLKLDSAEASASALSAEVARQGGTGAAGGTGTTTGPSSTATASPGTGPATVVAKSATPSPVAPRGKLTLTVKVTGTAERANMRVVGPGGFDKTYFLGKTGQEGETAVWDKTITAPPTPGTYHFYAIAFSNGKKVTMPSTANVTFVVK